jgi:WD40 repeat protein
MATPLSRFPLPLRRLVEARAKRFELQVGVSYTHALAFHPSGRWLVTADGSALVVIDLVENRFERLQSHQETLSSLAFDRTGERLVSVGWDGAMCVWDFPARTFLRFSISGDRIHSVALTADGKTAYMVGHEAVLIGVDIQSGRRIVEGTGHRLYCSAVGLSRDESLVISSDSAGHVRIWNRDGKCLHMVDHAKTRIIPYWPISIRFLESGNALFGCRMYAGAVFNPTTHEVERRFEGGHLKSVSDAVALERAGLVLTSSEDGSVGVWDSTSGALLLVFKPEEKWVYALAVSPDQATFATAGFGGLVRVWDVKTVAMAAREPDKLALIAKSKCEACGAGLMFVEDADQLGCTKCGGMYDFASMTKKRKKHG